MGRKKYRTLLIMPSTPGKRIRGISLDSYCCCIFYVMVGAILFLAGVGLWSIYYHNKISKRCSNLEAENRLAKSQLQDQTQRVEYVNRQLLKIKKQAVFVQKFLGLESQGIAKGQIGQGGEEVPGTSFLTPSLPSQFDQHLLKLADIVPSPYLSQQEISNLYADFDKIIMTLHNRQKEIKHTPYISPVNPAKSWISSSYGMRTSPFTDKKQFHLGIDIAAHKGTPIMATAKGKVIFLGKSGPLGLMAKIKHNSKFTTEYGHLLRAVVKKGQHVKRGEVIGYMGNTGRSTGYHIHYGIKKKGKHVNPFPFLMDWGKNSLLLAQVKE